MKPLVSIVIPAHNAENTLRDCLNSIMAQNFPREKYEVIVVNDSSTDRTQEIIANYDVRSLQSSARSRSKTRNLGFRAAQGQWIAFIDSDCIIESDWLTQMVHCLSHKQVGAAQCRIDPTCFRRPTLTDRYRTFFYELAREKSNSSAFYPVVFGAGCMFSREAFESVHGFDESLSDYEDMDLSWRILFSGFGFEFVESARLLTRVDPPGLLKAMSRHFEKGRGGVTLFKLWEKNFGRPWYKLFYDSPNFKLLSVGEMLTWIFIKRKWELLLLPILVGSYAAGSLWQFFADVLTSRNIQPRAIYQAGANRILFESLQLNTSLRAIYSNDQLHLLNLDENSYLSFADIEKDMLDQILNGVSVKSKLLKEMLAIYDVEDSVLDSDLASFLCDLKERGVFAEVQS